MSTRLIAISLLVVLAGFVAVLASVGLFVRDPLPILSPRVPVVLGPEAGIAVRLETDGGFRFQAMVTVPQSSGPTVVLRPVGSGGAPVVADVATLSSGQHIASGQFTAPGRWELSVTTQQAGATFGFVLRE